MKIYDVHEALKILQSYYITDSIQMVTRWIRDGKIVAERSENKKAGWKILEDDLFEFIQELRPGLPEVYSVHDEYVNKVSLNDDNSLREIKNTLKNDSEVKAIESVNELCKEENVKLYEQINTLETIIMQLQDELQVINERMLEIMQQNHELTEDNKILMELYEMLDDEIKSSKRDKENSEKQPVLFQEEKKSKDIKEKRLKQNSIQMMTFDKFKTIAEEIPIKMDAEKNEEEILQEYKEIYNQIYNEDGLVKFEQVLADGSIVCPFTKKAYKHQKSLIKNAVTYYFESVNREIEYQNVE
jgi:hypothetical protein